MEGMQDRLGSRDKVNEDEIDADLLVNLLERFRYGDMYYLTRATASEATTTMATAITSKDEDDEEDEENSRGLLSLAGNVSESSGSDVQIEYTENQIDSTERDNDVVAVDSMKIPVMVELRTEGYEIEREEEKKTSTESSEEPSLEKLLERYDLFCPNCDSCITERVILKRRTRGLLGSASELKPEKPNEPEKLVDIDETEPLVKVPAIRPDSEEDEEEEEGLIKPSSGAEEEHHRDLTAGEASSKDSDAGPNLESENIRLSDSNPTLHVRPRDDSQESQHVITHPTSDKSSSMSDMHQFSKQMGTFWWRLGDIKMDHILGFTKLSSKPLRVFWRWKPNTSTNQIRDKDTISQEKDERETSKSDALITTGFLQEHEEEKGERLGPEILKSIVYGGLTETIASLGVVSSAAGSSASTLNILALAIANLVGGLIVCAHKLRDLRNEDVDLVTSHSEEQQRDWYSELLGRRANFRFHVFITVLSYIIFSLIPPLVYAFTFHQTGNRNYTVVSVFAISLVCIAFLSMIKAYVTEPPKSYIKSVMSYVGIAVTSSGISFLVGDIVGGFVERLGWFDANQPGMSLVLGGIEPEILGLTSF